MNSRLHLPSSLTAVIAASATGAGTFCTSRQPRRLAEHRMLPLLKNSSRREKLFFAVGVLVAGAARCLTYLLER